MICSALAIRKEYISFFNIVVRYLQTKAMRFEKINSGIFERNALKFINYEIERNIFRAQISG